MTWCVWMLWPESVGGWSRVAAGLSEQEAKRFAEACLFRARAMPDQKEPEET